MLPKVLLILLGFVFFFFFRYPRTLHAYCCSSFVIRELSQRDARANSPFESALYPLFHIQQHQQNNIYTYIHAYITGSIRGSLCAG